MDSQITFKTTKGEMKLVQQDLIKGKVSMWLPDTFRDLSEEPHNNIVIGGQKIDVSKSTKDKTVVFSMMRKAFGDESPKSEDDYIKESVGGFRMMFSRLVPGYQEVGVFTKKLVIMWLAA